MDRNYVGKDCLLYSRYIAVTTVATAAPSQLWAAVARAAIYGDALASTAVGTVDFVRYGLVCTARLVDIAARRVTTA